MLSTEVRDLISKNQILIQNYRRDCEHISNKALSSHMHISLPTLLHAINELKINNILKETFNDFIINPKVANFLGINIYTSYIEFELIDFSFETIIHTTFQYSSIPEMYDYLFSNLNELYEKYSFESFSFCIIGKSKSTDHANFYLSKSLKFSHNKFSNIFSHSNFETNFIMFLKEKHIDYDSFAFCNFDTNRIGLMINNVLTISKNEIIGFIPNTANTVNTVESMLIYLNCFGIEHIFLSEQFKDNKILDDIWIYLFENMEEKYNLTHCVSFNPEVINAYKQDQKGTAIFAAYNFFNWKLQW